MSERSFNWLFLIPPLVFAAIAAAFYLGLERDNPNELPSAFAGRAAPALDLPELAGYEAPAADALSAPGVKLVNFWASWCGPCRVEHPTLMEMAESGIEIIGVNYKDREGDAQAFLTELGNPFSAVGADTSGRTGINWGLYGVPETFVIDGEGNVVLRHPGPVTRRVYTERIAPAIEAAR